MSYARGLTRFSAGMAGQIVGLAVAGFGVSTYMSAPVAGYELAGWAGFFIIVALALAAALTGSFGGVVLLGAAQRQHGMTWATLVGASCGALAMAATFILLDAPVDTRSFESGLSALACLAL